MMIYYKALAVNLFGLVVNGKYVFSKVLKKSLTTSFDQP